MNRHDIHDLVIHVISGKPVQSTFDGDGNVIPPHETIAAFDWSEDFRVLVREPDD